MNVFCLGVEQIDSLWDLYAHHLYRLEREELGSAEEVRGDLKIAKKQIWGLQDGPAVTGVVITTIQGSTCEVWGACGSASKEDMHHIHRAIEDWARSIGCRRMKIQGRRGWMRVFPDYRQTGVIIEKEL